MKKKLLLAFLFLSGLCCSAQAQLQPVKNVPSPEIAGLGEYGKIPVSLYTGVPNISIPLYEANVGNYTLPISMSYHIAAIKPNTTPGALGLGWSLIAGGYVTRTVRGVPDEKLYYSKDDNKWHECGFYSTSGKMKDIDVNKFLELNKSENSINRFEISADEFSFNFCGYSGNFYYNEDGGWSVVSDQDIKVVFNESNGFSTLNQLETSKRINIYNWPNHYPNERFFNKFTLVTPDGCQYEFGGLDATEYCISYYNPNNSDLIATTWRLSKITTVDKHIISFIYDTSGLICDLKYVPQESSIHFYDEAPRYASPTVGKTALAGFLIFPANIKKIITPNDQIVFSYAPDEYYNRYFTQPYYCLGWENTLSSQGLLIRHDIFSVQDTARDQFGSFLNANYLIKNDTEFSKYIFEHNLKNPILKSIYINDSYRKLIVKKVLFSYFANNDERRKLSSVAETYHNSALSGKMDSSDSPLWPEDSAIAYDGKTRIHQFTYNTRSIPVTDCIMGIRDSWGYYTGGTHLISAIPSFDIIGANQIYAQADILTGIRFPTGGRCRFIYKLHDYSSVVNEARNKLIPQSGTIGGLRIDSIIKMDENEKITEKKKYHYSETLHSTKSSGILQCKPINNIRYDTPIKVKRDRKDVPVSISFRSKGGFFPSVTSQNSPDVGYSCVIEETLDANDQTQGSIRYRYTNYGEDIFGEQHFDEPAIYSMLDGDSYIKPYSSKSMERGKLLSTEYLDKIGRLKKRITYKYKKTNSSYLTIATQTLLFLDEFDIYSLGALSKTYLYSYLTDTITETLYTDLENASIEKIQTMEYNAHKLLKKATTTTSQGNLRTEEYEYNSDDPFYQWSGLKHILNLVTKKTTTENGHKRQEKYEYGYGGDYIPYLSEVATTINNDPSQTTYKVKSAGYNGKPVEIEEQGVTSLLLWGYGGQRIIAKIVNASLDRLYALPGFGSSDYEDNWESDYAKIESIRQQLPSSQFFIYTYDNRLQLQSIANPNGVTEFFNYDFLGRLIERYYTERTENGWQKRLLNRYDYNYSL